MNRLFLVLIFVFFSSSVKADYCEGAIPNLKRLLYADPIKDAKESISNDDSRFLASYGYTYKIPGVSSAEIAEILETKNFKVVEGSGHNLCSWPESPKTLLEDIDRYLEIYNRTLTNEKT